MYKIDVAIIGGGVIGLAVASAVAGEKRDVFIFERHDSFGQETSSRNSEVIHSGIYYPKDSLKAKTCIDGNKLLYRICQANNIPHNKTGKLIVAENTSKIEALEALFKQGMTNGLADIKMLKKEEIKALEPNVEACQAIYLPMTGIIDSHALMKHFLMKAKSKGADILYKSEVKKVHPANSGYEVVITEASGEDCTFTAKVVINCAGLDSDTVAKMVGIEDEEYTLSYCKGDYFRIGAGKAKLVKKLVYPVCRQDDTSLGIHFTPDLAGEARLGPDAEYLRSREINYTVDPAKRDVFYDDVKGFLPFLGKEDLSADTSGVRPKLQAPGEGFKDFVIRHEEERGLTGFINLIGIESPGLTSAPAIANIVKEMASKLI